MVYRPTTRVLAVLELLQAHDHLTGAEIAERLEVDIRTVRRYISLLQELGVPVESEPGAAGGYSLRPDYQLPPMMFSQEELLALAVGLLLAKDSGLTGIGVSVESALAKIERVLPPELSERLMGLEDAILTGELYENEPEAAMDIVSELSQACQSGQRVRMQYESQDDRTWRLYSPYSIIYYNRSWYTVGYCHLRQDIRTFRIDRILEIAPTTDRFAAPPDFDALDYMLTAFEAIPDRWNIDVHLEMPLDKARQQVPRALATLTPEEDGVRLRASIHDLTEMARILVGLGHPITIYQPEELREAFRQLADEMNQTASRSQEG